MANYDRATLFNMPQAYQENETEGQDSMRMSGKQGKKWLATRRKWLKENPPSHEGYYYCYICGRAVPENEITLDHRYARTRRPDLRNELNNLSPCCLRCNTWKGSRNFNERGYEE